VLPADLVSPPVLQLGLALYLNAWFELDQERGISYTPKGKPTEDAISRRQCFDYAIYYDFDLIQSDDLWYYVAEMDRAYFTYKRSLVPKG
jgi:hypothetical protein